MKRDQDSAQVRIPPPLLLLMSILIGVGLQFLYPVHVMPPIMRWVFGILLIGTGLGVIVHCSWTFKKTGTAIEPWKKTSTIITSGFYKWSRNPIYLSFIVIGLGFAAALDNPWVAAMQAPLIIAINQLVIAKEEQYLDNKFDDSYRVYKRNVRRWI